MLAHQKPNYEKGLRSHETSKEQERAVGKEKMGFNPMRY
jgi:hypothetical protein